MSGLGVINVAKWTKILELPAEWNPGEIIDGVVPNASPAPRMGTISVLASPGGLKQQRIAFVGLNVWKYDPMSNSPLLLGTIAASTLFNEPQHLGPTLVQDHYDGRLIVKHWNRSYPRWIFFERAGYGYQANPSVGWRIPKESPQLILAALDQLAAQRAPHSDRSIRFPVQVTFKNTMDQPFPCTVHFDRVDKERGVILQFKFNRFNIPDADAELSSITRVANNPEGSVPFGLWARGGAFKNRFAHWRLSRADAQRILVAWDVLVESGG